MFTAFLNFDALFQQTRFVKSVCLLLGWIDNVTIDRFRIFWWPKIFSCQDFGEIIWQSKIFQRASVALSHFSRSKIPCMALQCRLSVGIWSVGCIQTLAGKFDFSTRFCPKFFWKKMSFETNFYLVKSLGNSACLKVIHIAWIEWKFYQCVQQCVLMQFLTASDRLSWIYCRKVSKNRFH